MDERVKAAIESGKWFLRRSNDGAACHNGFQWAPIGEWTEAPDWNDNDECGGGLHGNDAQTTDCFWSDGRDLDFCVYDGPMVRIGGGGKIKVKRAAVLLRNELPDNLTVGGSLNLRGTGITSLPDGLTVGGWLDLEGCAGITSWAGR